MFIKIIIISLAVVVSYVTISLIILISLSGIIMYINIYHIFVRRQLFYFEQKNIIELQ